MDQRTTFRYLAAILSLVVACAALAVLAPGRAQEATPEPLYLRVAAGDAAGLALAIQTANSVPKAASHIYLEGGSYAFSVEGLVLPPFSGHLVVYGNQAALFLDRTPLVVYEGAQVELRHLNLRWGGGQERGIFNEGILSLRDSTLSADENFTPEGGGILNRGQLTVERVSLNTLRRISSTDPGGAVYNAGTFNAQCAAFRGNHASQGGAIYNAEGGTSTVSDSVFEGNSANGGGAIFNADAHTLQALNNFWGGGAPLLEDLYRSTDTISSRVLVYPFLSSSPLELPGCATPPPDPIPDGAILSSCTSGGLTTPQPPMGEAPPSTPSPLICPASLPVPVANVNAPAAASPVVVTRIDDRNNPTCPSDDCSLREAIRTAPNGAVITFDAAISAPIVLTQPIRITGKTLTLQGRLDQPTIISGNDQFNLFILNESNTQRVILTLEYLTLTQGRAVVPNNGGAIYARDSFLIIRNSTLHHNRSTQNGGALYTEASTVTLTNVTLANNIAGTWGGAINNNRGGYTLTNTTIIDNQALGGIGGGMYSYVPVQQAVINLYNSLVARNTPGGNCAGDVFGSYNVVTVDGGDRYSPCGQNGFHNLEVTRAQLGVQEADSLGALEAVSTGALRDNGGPTLTVAILSSTSPLIDAADPNRCPLTDQRGVARVGICDVGGVEYQPLPLMGIIAYASNIDGDYEIYTVPADNLSATPTRITDNPANDHDPAISPDGRYLVFVSDRGGQPKLYYQDMQDPPNSAILLTDSAGEETHLRWSPDGKHIAFEADDTLHVYTQDTNSVWDVPKQGSVDYAPAWKDAQTLTFLSRADSPLAYQLCELNITTLSTPSCMVFPVRVEALAWQVQSPDPFAIAQTDLNRVEIVKITRNTDNQFVLIPTPNTLNAESLILSPDGNFAAYTQAGAVHLRDLAGKAVGSIANAVQPYWGVVYAPPTPTPTPTATMTSTPTLSCQITFQAVRYGFDQWFDADQHGIKQDDPTFTAGWVKISPANGNAGPYLVLQKYLNSNLVQIAYPNRPLWIDSGGGSVSGTGDCTTGYPTAVPTFTPVPGGGPTVLEIPQCIGVGTGIQFEDNGLTMDYASCRAINPTLLSLTDENDRQQLGRLISLLQNPNAFYNPAHKAEFRLRLTAFFCVELADETKTFSYQHLVNIFFALLQTNYAFVKAEPGLASIHGASCAIFGQPGKTLRFEHIKREVGSSEVAVTIGNRILLFYDEKDTVKPQIPANLIHEIGHYFNARLGGAIDNPGGISPTSPLGRMAKGELNVGGRDISGALVKRNEARIGMSKDPYTQNGGWTCANSDTSCGRNEEFADMFLHWVYEQPGSTIFVNDDKGRGSARRNFMSSNLTNWLCELRACGAR